MFNKNCPKRTFRSDFVKLRSEILYLFLAENGRLLLSKHTQRTVKRIVMKCNPVTVKPVTSYQ